MQSQACDGITNDLLNTIIKGKHDRKRDRREQFKYDAQFKYKNRLNDMIGDLVDLFDCFNEFTLV